MLAKEFDKLDLIGIDLVAMCVNDIVTLGAKPLFFLDYYATSKLDVDSAAKVINGIADGCKESNMALIGGETAEMPGVYKKGDFDLAGFCVGVVDHDNIIDGRKIEEGNTIIGIASSGPHSNGYSLIRKIIELNGIKNDEMLGKNKLTDAIITPTTIYVEAILNLTESYDLKGIAHITGGGIIENLPRVISNNYAAKINLSKIKPNKVIKWIIEVAALNNKQIIQLSTLIKNVVISNFKEDTYPSVFVKSSTGFYKTKDNLPNGATLPSIIMMLENASPLPIKAAGGVRNHEEAINLIRLGVKRIGTSAAKLISSGQSTS